MTKTAPPLTGSALHHAILRHIVDTGRAPDATALAAHFDQPRPALEAGLRRLADDHGVVLHPNSTRIWVAHPFSLAPTNFLVRRGSDIWWGNCAWCSLGIAALLGGNVTITTTLGAHDQPVTINITDAAISPDSLLVHFPVAMKHAWDNVIYTCSTMLVFDSETAIDAWCARHGIAKGDVQPIEKVFRFAQVWYGRHLDADCRKWTADEARAIFARFGLTGPIWDIPTSAARF